MTCLVAEIVKLCREDKPRAGEDITVIQSAGNAATIEFMKTIVQIVTMEAPVTCSTGRLPAATQKNKTVSSPLDANPKIIKKVDTVAITHGSLERECTKLRPAFNLTSIVRDIIDEKQMSAGCGDVCTTPIVDQFVRKNGGLKEKVGDSSQTAGGRETMCQRIATTIANYMNAEGKGTHSGYVTAPQITVLVELLIASACEDDTLSNATDEAISQTKLIIAATDYFNAEEHKYRNECQCWLYTKGDEGGESCKNCMPIEPCKTIEAEVGLLAKLGAGGIPKGSSAKPAGCLNDEAQEVKAMYSQLRKSVVEPKADATMPDASVHQILGDSGAPPGGRIETQTDTSMTASSACPLVTDPLRHPDTPRVSGLSVATSQGGSLILPQGDSTPTISDINQAREDAMHSGTLTCIACRLQFAID